MFLYSKETINKEKRQAMEWENVSANYISDKGLISKKNEELAQLNSKHKEKPLRTPIHKMEKWNWIGISPKMIYKGQQVHFKNAEHH